MTVKVFGVRGPHHFGRRCVCISRQGRGLRGLRRGTGHRLNVLPPGRFSPRSVHKGFIRNAGRLGHEGRDKHGPVACKTLFITVLILLCVLRCLIANRFAFWLHGFVECVDSVVHLLPSSITGRVTTKRIVRHPTSIVGRLIRGTVSTNTRRISILMISTKGASVRIVSSKGNVSRASTHLSFRHRTASGVHRTTSLFTLRAVKFHKRTLTSVTTITRIRLHAHVRKRRLKAVLAVSNSGMRKRRTISYPGNDDFDIGGLFFGIPTHHGFLGSGRARLDGVLARFRQVMLIGPRISFALRRGKTRLFGLPTLRLHRHVVKIFKGGVGRRLLSLSMSAAVIHISKFMKGPRATHGGKTHRCFFMGKQCVHRPCFRGTVVSTCRRLIPINRRMSCFVCFRISPTGVSIGVRPAGARVGFRGRRTV